MTESADRDAIEQLAEEFLERHRRGERPSVTEYAQAHPKLAAEIRDVFPAILLAERLGAPTTPSPTTDIPDQLDEFRIIREIGRGGMGVVYEAIQEPLGRHVALKVLPPAVQTNPTYRERFQREARAVGRLQHPNIIPVYGVGEHAGVHYFAMQFISGRGLDTVLREIKCQRGRARTIATAKHTKHIALSNDINELNSDTETNSDSSLASLGGNDYYRGVAQAGLQIAEALAYAHDHGIWHRDIKPANLLIDAQGTVWVSDFGLAKAIDDGELTNTGDLIGTMRYMAPERFRGESDPGCDVYGLGMTLYELVTLRPAFLESDRPKLIEQILHDDPIPPRQLDQRIPRDLETIIVKAIAKEPRDRYLSAHLMAEDLRRFLADQPILARPVAWSERAWRWCRRNPILATTTSIIAVLVLAISVASPIVAIRMWEQRRQALQELWTANLARAESARATNLAGRRFDGLAALDAAQRLVPTLRPDTDGLLKLRNHFVASLSLSDLGMSKRWPGYPPGSAGVAFDAALERYARSDKHGNISIRRVANDSEIDVLDGNGEAAWSLRFSPDGKYLAVGYQPKYAQDAKQIRVWNCQSKSPVIESMSSAYCSDSAFSADSRFVAFGQNDATLAIYDLNDPSQPPQTMTLKVPTNAIAFHPNGQSISLAQGRNVENRELTTGKVLHNYPHERPVGSVAWRGDGRKLATTSAKLIYLWEVDSTAPDILRGHERDVTEATFSRKGDLLGSRGYDGTVRLWDVDRKQPIVRTFNVFTGCSQLQFGPGDQQLGFACDGLQLWVWDIAQGVECRSLIYQGAGALQTLAGDFHPDGHWLAVATSDGVRICSTATTKEIGHLPMPETWTVQWVENGLVTSGKLGLHHWSISPSSEGRWHIGRPRKILEMPMEVTVTNRAGGCIVARGKDQVFRIIRGESPPIALNGHPRATYAAASSTGQIVATGALHDQQVALWDATSGAKIKELPVRTSAAITFVPRSDKLLVASERDYSLWDLTNEQVVFRIPKQPEDIPYEVSLTRDGECLLVRHDPTRLRLYELATQNVLAELQTPTQQTLVWHRISDDGRYMAAGTTSGLVYLWDLNLIRRQLAPRGLDWSTPFVPPASAIPGPLEIELDSELYLVRANSYLRNKQYDRALADATSALNLDPHSPLACNFMSTILVFGPTAHRSPHKALPLAQRAAAALPDRLDFQLVLAATHYRLDQIEDAIAILEQFGERADGPALFLHSACHCKSGKTDLAKEYYAKGLIWWRKQGTLTGQVAEWTPILRSEAEALLLAK